jgi:hypothetical protein
MMQSAQISLSLCESIVILADVCSEKAERMQKIIPHAQLELETSELSDN